MKIIHDSELKEIPIPCGRLRQYFKYEDLEVDLNRIDIGNETKSHYHKTFAEFYLITKGNGLMRIRNRETGEIMEKEVKTHTVILVPINHAHQLINTGDEVLAHYVLCKPHWRKDDEIFEEI